MQPISFGVGTKHFKKTSDIDESLIEIIKTAINAGFNCIDCAEIYNTEAEVGIAIKDIPRDKLFITTKIFANGQENPEEHLRKSLEKLGLEYVDLYLIHSPFKIKDLVKYWDEMCALVGKGLTRHVGVSNFQIEHLEALKDCKVQPFCNQIEFHPYLQQKSLTSYCQEHGIKIVAYSPLASLVYDKQGPLNPLIDKLAEKYQATHGQVLFAWVFQQNHYLITTSGNPARIESSLKRISISEDDLKEISKVGATHHYRRFWTDYLQ